MTAKYPYLIRSRVSPDMKTKVKILNEHWKCSEAETVRKAIRWLCLREDIQEILEDAHVL